MKVSVLLANDEGNDVSARDAGPITTAPPVLNREPWQGHTNCDDSNPLTVQASCVHVAVRTVNAVSLVRAIKKLPIEVLASAAVPADPSAPDAGMVMETTRPETVAVTLESCGAEPPPGELGLPPHA